MMQQNERYHNPREAFLKDGYYLFRNMFPTKKMEEACAWLDAQDPKAVSKSWTEAEPGVKLAVLPVVHKGDNPLSGIANHQTMLDLATELMGSPVYIWSSKVNMKAAWHGSAEYYHQDYVYWKGRGYQEDKMLTCMVFLEKHDLANGGLHVLPGTHCTRLDHVPFVNINGVQKFMIPAESMNDAHKKHGIKVIDANPGDVLMFHSSLIHGSSHNASPRTRKILLSQLNTVDNQPQEVHSNAREYNLWRAKFEMDEAEKRFTWFKGKYEQQLKSDELTFAPPIPEQERKKGST